MGWVRNILFILFTFCINNVQNIDSHSVQDLQTLPVLFWHERVKLKSSEPKQIPKLLSLFSVFYSFQIKATGGIRLQIHEIAPPNPQCLLQQVILNDAH